MQTPKFRIFAPQMPPLQSAARRGCPPSPSFPAATEWSHSGSARFLQRSSKEEFWGFLDQKVFVDQTNSNKPLKDEVRGKHGC